MPKNVVDWFVVSCLALGCVCLAWLVVKFGVWLAQALAF